MAQKVTVTLVDDLDGSQAEETVEFGLDGATYTIDLSGGNAGRLREAVAAHPVLVAGHGFLDTRLSERFGTRVFSKTGAEGVFCAALPEQGLGLALKCDDGAPRASQAVLVRLLSDLMHWTEDERAVFADSLDPEIRNWNGMVVGRIRTTDAVDAAAG